MSTGSLGANSHNCGFSTYLYAYKYKYECKYFLEGNSTILPKNDINILAFFA